VSLGDLFEGRHQLIVYRYFYEPGVTGWPEKGCYGCSLVADQVAHPAHLHARDTTLAFVSHAPQANIERWRARMGWELIPWYTLTGRLRRRLRCRRLSRHQRLFPRRRPELPRVLRQRSRRRGDGRHLEHLDITALGRQEEWEDSPAGYPQTPPYTWWRRHDEYDEPAAAEAGASSASRE
jgi:predicted dithiol-disulfide oxidoreductase (DUF899 family)